MTAFCFVRDDDGHWFLVPADKQKEANDYIESITKYWAEGDMETDPPAMPEYMREIDSPFQFKFDNPRYIE